MHLQKLCYIEHGFALALFDKTLTSDTIEAWDYGPVYPELYDALKKYGSGDVHDLICANNLANFDHIKGPVVTSSLSHEEEKLIETVWNDYGSYEAFKLSALTHEPNSPWAKIYIAGKKQLPIQNTLIKEYFLAITNAHAWINRKAEANSGRRSGKYAMKKFRIQNISKKWLL
ncbi:MAG: Panacea domain-containing protein [Methylocella sp.]